MTDRTFDLYATSDGYVAVASEVRRRILHALEAREMGLVELVEVTGRSKPTLSSLHLPALLDAGLIGVRDHPTDGRKKLYRLIGERRGSSDPPSGILAGRRDPMDRRPSPDGHVPIREVLALVASGSGSPSRRSQAKALGALHRDQLATPPEPGALEPALALLIDAGILSASEEAPGGTMELVLEGPLAAASDHAEVAGLLGAFLHGLAAVDGEDVLANVRLLPGGRLEITPTSPASPDG